MVCCKGIFQNFRLFHAITVFHLNCGCWCVQELRAEDYAANRKGKQGGTGGSFFGQTAPATQASTTGFNFGQPAAASTGGFCKWQ